MLPITADAGLATDKVESTGYWLANVTLLALFALYGCKCQPGRASPRSHTDHRLIDAHVVIDHCHHRGYLRPLDLCSQRVFAHILLRLGAASAVAASIALCVVLQWAAGKEESTMSAVGSGHAVNVST